MRSIRPSVLALAACTFAPSAFAQADGVTIYGIADAAVRRTSGLAEFAPSPGSTSTLTSGVDATSRLGFRGKEDLGGGLRAIFQLESGLNVDTGATANSTKFFDRQSWVGLGGSWGSLTLGRQTSLLADAIAPVDPLALRLASYNPNINIAALSQHGLGIQYGPAGSTTGSYRLDNAAKYTGTFADVTVRGMYGFGEQPGSSRGLDAYGAGLSWQTGAWALSGAYMHLRNAAQLPLGAWVVGAAIPAGPVNVKLTYGESDAETTPANHTKNRTLGAGIGGQIGLVELTLAYYDVKRRRTSLAADGFGRTVGFVEYHLSKSTRLYAELDATAWRKNYQGAANKSRGEGASIGVMKSF